MDISSLSSSDSSILDSYGEGMVKQVEQAEKLAKINLELQMEAQRLELAKKTLIDIFA